MNKEELIKEFEKIAYFKDQSARKAGLTCACGKCNLAKFNLKEILEVINNV